MKRQKRQSRANQLQRRQRLLRSELLEPRLPLAVDTWEIDLSATGTVDLFGPTAGGQVQQMYEDNPISEGNVIATSNVPGQNNQAPTITTSATPSAAENQTAVIDIDSTDPEGDTEGAGLTYALTGGADQALFSVDMNTGVLTFNAAPDFENPGDANVDNVYDVVATVTDSLGGMTSQTLAVTVTDVNDAPVITSDGGGATAAVNAAENQTAVTTVTATDEDLPAQTLTFSITGGADQALFGIVAATGVLTFNAAPDFENPTDAGMNNVYDVQVTVTDNGAPNLTDVQDIAVTVTDANDAPVITSDGGGATAAVNAAENQTAVTTVTATDEDLPAQTLTFSISGGADQALFGITAGGVLTFLAAPDFENPADAGMNNVYDVQVTVTDNGAPNLTDVQDIAVTVTDVNDNPVITSDGGGATAAVNAAENQTAVTTVTATDEDLPAQTLTFTITGGADQALFGITAGGIMTFLAAPDFENPTDAGMNNVYDVQVTVTDNGAPNLTDVQDIAVTVTDVNDAPVITSDGGGATASVNAAENQTAVTTVTAIDKDLPAQTLTFSISGGVDQALFGITAGGVLTFLAAPDFENPADAGMNNVYDVQVTVTDNGAPNLTDVQDIAVTVTDVNDAPVITSDGGGATAAVNAAENQTAVTTVTATDEDLPAQTLTFTITGGADQALFGITAGGIMTFLAAPDFENPTDAGMNNVYDVQVTVTDNGAPNLTDVQDIAVTVTDVNDNPVITSDGGGATASVNAAENQTAVTTVTATDEDLPAQTLTFSLSGGADQALFGITAGGILTFLAAPDFENPADAGMNNVYDVQVTVTDNGAPNLTDVQDIAVTVTDVNDAPVITSDGGGATASVNAAENQTAVTTVTATDEDLPAQTLTFTITGGADQALFGITAGGIMTFLAAPDFENPADAGMNNVYDVQVTVTDNGAPNLTDVQDIAVTVTDVNDAPVITSDGGGATASVNAAENQTAVTTVTATDEDLPAQTLTFSLSGGADQALFGITAGGILTFLAAPDFENPADAGMNNVYDVQVTVTDNGAPNLTDVQDIAVTVTDVNDAPVITSDGGGATASVNAAENQTAVTTVTATDEDLPAQTLTFSLSGGADQALFGITAGGILTFLAAPDFENPADAGMNNVYDVQVTVTDNGAPNLTDVQDIAVTVTDVNDAPVITSDGGGATASVNAAENQTAVTTVTATDEDLPAQTLTFSLSGGADQALFGITAGGVLTFNAAPDFENPTDAGMNNVYDVQVTVTDNGAPNLTDVQDIAVTVTDVNDAPVITSDGGGATASVNAAENQTAVTTVTATDEDLPAQTLTFSLSGGADQALFGITAGGVLTFNAAPDFENPTDAGMNNVYDVQVTVTDNGAPNLTDVQDIAVTVTDVNDAPVITSDGGGATASINVDENTTAVTTATATDEDLPAQTLTFTITGGADQALFGITAGGVLTFNAAPDFENPADAGMNNVYDVQVTVTDNGAPNLTDVQDIAVTVDDVAVENMAPVITSNGGGATAAVNAAENQTAVTDVQTTDDNDSEGSGLTYSLTTVAGGGVDNGLFTLNTTTGLLTFTSAPNFEIPGDNDMDNDYEVQVTVTDSGPGAPLTDMQDITVTVTNVNDPPVIGTDPIAYTTAANTQLRVAGAATTAVAYVEDASGIPTKASVTDEDSVPSYSLDSGPTSGTAVVNALGTFLYTPNPGFVGVDSFDFEVSDGLNMVTGTVNVTVTDANGSVLGNQAIWYVENNAAGGGNGTSSSPFNTLSDAESGGGASSIGDTIFLLEGDGTTTNQNAGVALANDQLFIGHTATTLVANGTTIQTPAPGGKPEIEHATTGNAIQLAGNNTILGIDIGNTGAGTGTAISGTSFGTLMIDNVDISGTGGLLNLDTGTVTDPNGGTTFTNLISSANATKGIDLNSVAGAFTVGTQTSITSSSDIGVEITSSTGSFSFADLDITTTNDTGLFADGGTVNSTSGTISTGTGTSIDIDNTTLGLTLTSVTHSGGTSGIDLLTTGGSFTIVGDGGNTQNGSGGSITGTTSHGIVLNGANNVSITSLDLTSPGDGLNEHGISATNITGSHLFRAGRVTAIGQTGGDGINIRNTNTNLTLFEINNSLFTGVGSGGNDAVFMETDGTTVARIDVTGGTHFQGLQGDGLQVTADTGSEVTVNVADAIFSNDSNVQTVTASRLTLSAANGTNGDRSILNIDIRDSIFRDTGVQDALLPVGAVGVIDIVGNQFAEITAEIDTVTIQNIEEETGIRVVGDDNTQLLTVLIENSTFNDINDSAIRFNPRNDTVNADLTISNNDFGTGPDSIVNNGNDTPVGVGPTNFSDQAISIDVADNAGQTGSVDVLIQNNRIVAGAFDAIRARSSSDSGTNNTNLHISILGNTAHSQSDGAFDIEADNGGTVCLNMNSPAVAGDINTFTSGAATASAIDREADGGLFSIQGLTGGTNAAAVNTFLTNAGRNSISPSLTVDANTYTVGGTCNTPALPLVAANGHGPGSDAIVTSETLGPIIEQAIAAWSDEDLTDGQRLALSRVTVEVADLPAGVLGESFISSVRIDVDAAGHGWFIDATPDDALEFAEPGSSAAGKMDLLTVVMHEMGHVLGQDHQDAPSLMADELPTGTRRFIAGSEVTVANAEDSTRSNSNASDVNDVNRDGVVSGMDALEIVNRINAADLGSNPLTAEFQRLDTNGDGFITSLDVMAILSHFNRVASTQQTREHGAESESVVVLAGEREPAAIDNFFATLGESSAVQGPRRPEMSIGGIFDLEDDLLDALVAP